MTADFFSNLKKLESLSIEISDLIYKNKFNEIPKLDALRQDIIKNISKNQTVDKKKLFLNLIEENKKLILSSEKKLSKLKSHHSKFNNVFQAYSSSN